MTLSLKELMEEDGTFEKAILKVESTIKDDVAKIYSYYDNEYIYLILMDEVEEVADLIRRAYALDGIPCISFEIYIYRLCTTKWLKNHRWKDVRLSKAKYLIDGLVVLMGVDVVVKL